MSISRGIRVGLARHEMTQDELADAVGRRRETVSSWCNGHSMPGGKMLELIAAAFSVELSVLIKWGE